jgi:esterase/lipase superfamily enzyme
MREVAVGRGRVVAFGHYGRPVLAFPAEAGSAWEWHDHGMVDAVGGLLGEGRCKLYCVDAWDAGTWSDHSLPTDERARRHEAFEAWLHDEAVPWIAQDCGGTWEVMTAGVSMGAFHAVTLALRRADRFPLAIGLSGNYEPATWHGWGEPGDTMYFNDPMAYVAGLEGPHLAWLQEQLSVLLVVGQGAWEHVPTRALESTRRFADLLWSKGVRCELDVWGYDVPHDWPSWQRQLAHHLPRLC